MVTYNQTIANLKSIATTPAELESTTLVFAHGLDYFYIRLAPAKAFDVLPQDFNYELLVLLCLGFLSGTYVLKALTLRKSLNEAWK
jgi:ER membrane protein complex subunit 1